MRIGPFTLIKGDPALAVMRPSTESQVALNFRPNLPISGQVNPVNPAESTCAAIAEKLSKLPPFGPAVQNLLRISLDDDSAVRLFEDAFMSDPALTAELLRSEERRVGKESRSPWS